MPLPLRTAPPLRIVRTPLPKRPTERSELLVQVEPAPSTVAVPIEDASSPMMPKVLFTVPPFWIVSAPVPETPTRRPVACAPAAPTIVALGVAVSILVLSVLVGTPAVQLPA